MTKPRDTQRIFGNRECWCKKFRGFVHKTVRRIHTKSVHTRKLKMVCKKPHQIYKTMRKHTRKCVLTFSHKCSKQTTSNILMHISEPATTTERKTKHLIWLVPFTADCSWNNYCSLISLLQNVCMHGSKFP